MAVQAHREISPKKPKYMSHVVWVEESKNGIGFETGPNYAYATTTQIDHRQ